ncbi:hypothetical protein EEJ34_13360 [Vibrio cholerae]|nr:hypothetical protein [Vibrio cholerae]EJL6837091.1 hypothetical protein [Vibrio cholerae]ELN9189075.1 hypothetical protein [Vibrio cholerae]RBM26443.1 hypothetical protein DLR58_19150 [Vibrio tarriae]RNE63531.1 hypothetical protein EEJ34_13360 [Vibrio cholerae]
MVLDMCLSDAFS